MRATTPTRVLSPIFALMALVVVTLGVPPDAVAQTETLQVEGLAEPVEILIDRRPASGRSRWSCRG